MNNRNLFYILNCCLHLKIKILLSELLKTKFLYILKNLRGLTYFLFYK